MADPSDLLSRLEALVAQLGVDAEVWPEPNEPFLRIGIEDRGGQGAPVELMASNAEVIAFVADHGRFEFGASEGDVAKVLDLVRGVLHGGATVTPKRGRTAVTVRYGGQEWASTAVGRVAARGGSGPRTFGPYGQRRPARP